MERGQLGRSEQAIQAIGGATVLFLFLTHLAIGVAFTLLLVGREAGIKFFRFNAGLAVVLLAVGLALRPEEVVLGADAQGVALAALLAGTAVWTFYWATAGRMLATWRPWLLRLGVGSGIMALAGQAVALTDSAALAALTMLSFLTSAALLGGSCTSMILGHWYLVLPSMDISLLQSMVKFHIGSTVVRMVAVGVAVGVAILTWEAGSGPSFQRYVLSSDGIFFWQRVLFGLGGPLVLAYLTWETAKIRSTQSATGILYVDLFAVIVGEVLAKYLLLSTGVPL